MNGLYDNGEMLLGTKRDILNYIKRQFDGELIAECDYHEVIDVLRDLDYDTIIAINYDHGMGMSFDWWTNKDKMDMEVY